MPINLLNNLQSRSMKSGSFCQLFSSRLFFKYTFLFSGILVTIPIHINLLGIYNNYKFCQFRSSLPLILPKTQLIVSVFIQLSHIVHLSEKNVNKSLVFSYVFRKSWKLIHLKNIKICWKILLVSEFGFSFSFV